MVRRRQIYHIAGYDPDTPADFYQRFVRQIEIFKSTWGLDTAVSKARQSVEHWDWAIEAAGPNWRVQSHFELWRWDDIVCADAERPRISRLLNAAITYLDLLFTGTIYRYTQEWQYGH